MSNSQATKTKRRRRYGLSLLEVMLAIAILGGSVAVLGELIRVGALGASTARDEAKAQLLCASKMAEISTGLLPPEPLGPIPFELEDQWTYTIAVLPIDEQELLAVNVYVEQIAEPDFAGRVASYQLTRWIAQPEISEEEMFQEAEEEGSTHEDQERADAQPRERRGLHR